MSNHISPIPEGLNSVIPYLVVPNAVEAITFYEKALGAEQVMRMLGPGGQGTMHAEIRLGGSAVMLTDENPQWEMKSPATLGGSPVSMMIYVENVDEVFSRAVEAGCEVKFAVSDMFWGDRMGKLIDPFGYQWAIATHIEDVPGEQMAGRQEKWLAEMVQSPDKCGSGV